MAVGILSLVSGVPAGTRGDYPTKTFAPRPRRGSAPLRDVLAWIGVETVAAGIDSVNLYLRQHKGAPWTPWVRSRTSAGGSLTGRTQ